MLRSYLRVLSCAFVFAVCSAFAQNGTIHGTVTDPAGASVPNASIKAFDQDKQVVARETTTNQEGVFNLTPLLPGHYTVTATSGESKWTGEITVPWGVGKTMVDLPLEPVAAPPPTPVPENPPTVATNPPVKPPTDTHVKPPPTDPVAPPAVDSTHAGKIVTNAQFSAWLANHADWQHDAAIASKLADPLYLDGWSGTDPPAGASGSPGRRQLSRGAGLLQEPRRTAETGR